MITQGQANFHARVKRINSGKTSSVPCPGVLDGSSRGWEKSDAIKKATKAKAKRPAATGGGMLAFVIGLLSVLMSQYAMFQLQGIPDPSMTADMRMLLDLAVAGGVSIGFVMIFRVPFRANIIYLIAGIVLAVSTMHNLVHLFPEPFETAFSGDWVEQTTSTTEKFSILFRGETFKLI